ncbi:glycosyltransferase [Chlorobium phaeovibrioides]|uniref:Glycosyltransferase n=2 Tax=Chlorobium phaeovibrioides TaxID=1094 RepID=A0A3S0NJ83_CHLPH|nr:glycosyltransferase [Chlorobium phaeovibrioides]
MRLAYITRVLVPSRAAQSMQIASMAKAFAEELGDDFFLQCGGKPVGDEPYSRRMLALDGSGSQRHLAACLSAVRLSLTDRRDTVVYTRDIAVAFTAILLGKQAVYEAHKAPVGSVPARILRWLGASKRFRLVVISGVLADYYAKRYGIPDARLLVAHSGVFPGSYESLQSIPKSVLRSDLGLPLNAFIVVHTGSLYRGRGAELFEQVVRSGEDVLFVQVGGEPDDIFYWKRYYQQRGLSNIQFVDRQPSDTVRRYQVAADLLFYMITTDTPTYWCCSPLKLFEYMASGTPILGSCIGSIKEILNENNAWCFSPERPDGIRASIADFRRDTALANRKSATALQQARKKYSWGVRAQRIIDFCNEGSER